MFLLQNAIATKFREGRSHPRENWLDYSNDKYGEDLVNDTRVLLRILLLYLPLPLFWTLYDQKGSRWTFQAEAMDGDFGLISIKPDHMQVVNPLLVLILIPLFESVIYPILGKIGIQRPLQKITTGGILIAISFLLSAAVQFEIESSPHKSVNILWQLPQYFVLTTGEIMFSPTGLAFSYEEAPKRMKSVIQACWTLTTAIGNLITIIFVAKLRFFDSQKYEFILFAALLIVDVTVFAILAYFYKGKTRNNTKATI